MQQTLPWAQQSGVLDCRTCKLRTSSRLRRRGRQLLRDSSRTPWTGLASSALSCSCVSMPHIQQQCSRAMCRCKIWYLCIKQVVVLTFSSTGFLQRPGSCGTAGQYAQRRAKAHSGSCQHRRGRHSLHAATGPLEGGAPGDSHCCLLLCRLPLLDGSRSLASSSPGPTAVHVAYEVDD